MPTNALDAVLGTNSSAIYRQMTTASRLLHYQSSSPNNRTARSMSQTLAEGPPAEASTCTHVLCTRNVQCVHVCRAVCALVRWITTYAYIISSWMKEHRFNFDLHHTQLWKRDTYIVWLTGCCGSVWVGDDSVSSPESSSGSCHTLTIPSSAPVASKRSWNGEKVKSVRKAEWAAIMGKWRKRPWLCRGSTAKEPTPENNNIIMPCHKLINLNTWM